MRTSLYLLGFVLLLATSARPADVSTTSLDGDWHFLADPDASLDPQKLATAANVRPTRIPSSWQSQFADLRDYAGVAWYWRTISTPPPAADQAALLKFGAVDYAAQIFVNGQKAGSHEGGYLPFEIDVTPLLHAGDNQIAVRVTDPGSKPRSLVEGINYEEIPHGKQNWYVENSGIWQSVQLDYRPRTRLGNVHISAGTDGAFAITVPVIVAGPSAPVTVTAEVLDPSGNSVWKGTEGAPAWTSTVKLNGRIPDARLWSPSSPSLYALSVLVSSGDKTQCRFGFRSFVTRDGKFYLNGRPFYMRGALDQDFYPDTIYTPPSIDALRDEMRKAKALGLNLLRCHIKIPDPRYLEAADEIGVLLWYELPNWDKLTADSQRRGMETLHGMVERDANHPSIVIVSIINESWGARLKEVADRTWLKSAYDQAKGFVPWLVVDNSACCENFHMATDIADYHQYASIPDYASNFDRLLDDQAQRPGWLFSPYGDSASKGNEPLVLSEFGNWGLPQMPENEPWWFSRAFGSHQISQPEGIEKRFTDYQYNLLFPDLKSLIDATEWHEYSALNYEIGALRQHSEIQGYVVTEFTDVNWEANGLLDMWRQPKVFGEALGKIQQDDLLVIRSDKRNYRDGETVAADVYVSHYSADDLTNARLDWQVEGTSLAGSLPISAIPSAGATKAGTIHFPAPNGAKPAKRILKARLSLANKNVSENALDLYFYPNKSVDLPPPVSFYDPPPGRLRRLVNDMHGRGYLAPSGAESFPVLITSTLDETVKNKLKAGARVVLIASDAMTLAPGIEIAPRSSGDLSGNWISDFLWLHKDHAPFTEIGFGTLAGFEAQAANPAAVVRGIPPEEFKDVLAGVFFGWIQENDGVLVQAKAGKGKLLICTFSLATSYNSDPYATYLLDALVNYAASDFKPHFELPL